MPIEILMPALSPTMEEGKLAKWLVDVGQQVRAGDVIAEIETDKATMEVEAVDEGKVGALLIAAGTEKVAVNTPIAILLADGESVPPSSSARASAAPAAPPPQQTAAKANGGQAATAAPSPTVAPQASASAGGARQPAAANGVAHGGTRIFASPLARRIARERGIDIAALKGSGPHGRVVLKDVEGAPAGGQVSGGGRGLQPVSSSGAQAPAASAGQLAPAAMPDDKILALYDKESYEVVPHDGMRRVIAQRLTQSKQTVPHFYLSLDCVLDDLLRARARINAAAPKDGPRAYKLSVNDFVIKALALALQNVPAANATWTEAGMLRHRHSDIGVAVAIEGGLFTPVIR
ncbi:MAG: 2-oxo acid dehydrogenase subunit E2, partial [Hyphomicrobiaceae bacterium]